MFSFFVFVCFLFVYFLGQYVVLVVFRSVTFVFFNFRF